LVREAVAVFSRDDGLHTLRVEVPESLPPVRADADRIRQVLTNLLSNAIKYSPQGGEVITSVRQEEATLVVGVTDRGIGMTPENVKKLFTKFYRVNNAETRQIGGTGLGLA
jgi:signal transduction histidine kinase